jgi:hypothetical protein
MKTIVAGNILKTECYPMGLLVLAEQNRLESTRVASIKDGEIFYVGTQELRDASDAIMGNSSSNNS